MNLGRGISSSGSAKDNGTDQPLIITISGDLGSGKSLLANALVERWEADRYSTGMVQRKIAEKRGITTLELNKQAETDKSIDEQIDAVFRNLVKTPKNLIVDSRMAFHFLEESFKIKLEVHPRIAAERIQNDTSRVGEGNYSGIDAIMEAILARKGSERDRFKRYYDADIEDHAGYTLIINTTDCPPETVSEVANQCVESWKKGQTPEKLWVSPRHVVALADPAGLDATVVERYKVSWPLVGTWEPNAVCAVKVGHSYVVTKGAEWVSAGLKAGKHLMPITLVEDDVAMPDPAMIKAWEEQHGYKHLV